MSRITPQSEARAAVPAPSAGFARLFFDNTAGGNPIPRIIYPDGTIATPVLEKARLFVNPITDYGAKFDHRVVFDGATAGGGVVTSNTIAFSAADVGKNIVLTGAGVGGAQYAGTITSINSAVSANVAPATTTAVAAKGLQVYTDDLAAWTSLINDVNNSPYPGAVIELEAAMLNAFGTSGFTNRSGISSFLPQITKQIHIEGIGGTGTSDVGDYSKTGGSCIAYAGPSNAPTAFGAVLTIAPTAGAAQTRINGVVLRNFWIDCRNGDQNEALKGIKLQSCSAFTIDNVFVNDPCAYGMEMDVISPGTPGALGEAKDCTRGMIQGYRARCLDAPAAAPAAFTTTTSAVVLTAVGQNLTLAGALANQPAAGYVWVMTTAGYPVLVNYTGGGGTVTLTGCTVSAQDAIGTPTTVNGSNVIQAHPGNASGLLLDGDATANANLCHFDTLIISHGATWGPSAIDARNCDSNEFTNVVINGGSSAVINAINRVTKPGVRLNGSITAIGNQLSARNNVFRSGSAGVGGCSQMGVNNAGALLATLAGPNAWYDYQLPNGESIPVVEGSTSFLWNANGGMGLPLAPTPVAAIAGAGQAIAAATSTLITGSLIAVPPQGFQVGTTLRWTIALTKTAAGVAARTFFIRIGTTGTVADAAVATITSALGTAAIDVAYVIIEMQILSLGAAAAVQVQFSLLHNGNAVGFSTTPMQVAASNNGVAAGTFITVATFNSTTMQQFISASLTTGVAEVVNVNACKVEVVKPANP